MKWVRCIYKGELGLVNSITIDKIYKVIEYKSTPTAQLVKIINDYKDNDYYPIWLGNNKWFKDVTDVIRDNKINSILNE